MSEDSSRDRAYQFIAETIDSVPQLEALLLLWNTRPEGWEAEDVSRRLYVNPVEAERILHDLANQGLISRPTPAPKYAYLSMLPELDELLACVDQTYRAEIVTVSKFIHSKGSPAVRAFARAFRLKKEGN